jgi:hypothetical protein
MAALEEKPASARPRPAAAERTDETEAPGGFDDVDAISIDEVDGDVVPLPGEPTQLSPPRGRAPRAGR